LQGWKVTPCGGKDIISKMTKEIFMSDEKINVGERINPSELISLQIENATNTLAFDPEVLSQKIARSLCAPASELYRKSPELKKDPFKAIEAVKLTGIKEEEIVSPVAGLMVSAAKLETARKELNLNPKQTKIFNGVLENIHGATAWLSSNKKVRNTVLSAEIIGLSLTSAGCANIIKNIETPSIETPAAGEAIPVGLLDAQIIENLPAGEVKDSFEAELTSIKEACAEIPGCMGDTVQIYRVIVPDNVFSYRFADVKDGDGERTKILSIMDGKTQESIDVNKDLIALDTVIEGTPSRVFGYIDDMGNSHYILINSKTANGNEFQVFDAKGNIYDVITQNEKEVQAYSHLWEAPGIVSAESLSTPTATEAATPTMEALNAENFKVIDGKIQENKNGNWQEVATPPEVGEIVSVELHEGKMYGIDTVDRAMVVRNESGEWVKFERPILGASFNEYRIKSGTVETTYSFGDFPISLLKDIPSSQIRRMVDSQLESIPWGYQKGSYSWKDSVPKESDPLPESNFIHEANFSGYFLGVIEGAISIKTEEISKTFSIQPYYIFEIPHKYERQIIVIYNPKTKDNKMIDVNIVDEANGRIMETRTLGVQQINDSFQTNLSVLSGRQIIVELNLTPDTAHYEDHNGFWQNCINENGYDIHIPLMLGYDIWINSSDMP